MDATNWIALVGAIVGSGGFSAFGGYLLAGRNDRKKDERQSEREVKALSEKQAVEGRNFQRETLLELQDLLYSLNRNFGKARHADEMKFRETGRYGRDQLPGSLSDEFTELLTEIHRLRVRIFDPELRNAINDYASMAVDATGVGARQEGDDEDHRREVRRSELRMLNAFGPLEEKLGAAIRSQFPGSDLTALARLRAGEANR